MRRTAAVAAVCLLVTVASGCGDAGGLVRDGRTPTAVSPDRLWPDLTPASSPAFDIGEVDREAVRGVPVPGDDIREADPVAVVRAEIAAHPDDYTGARAPYRDTSPRVEGCGHAGEGGRCPVLRPYYRDLTGDGRPELTLGFRLPPAKLTAVRVYTVDEHRLTRIMAYEDAVSGVELADRSVIIRAPSEVAGYEYRLQWTWAADQRAMLLTHDEMLRTDDGQHLPRPQRSTRPGRTPPGSPTSSGSPASSGNPVPSGNPTPPASHLPSGNPPSPASPR
ncbi:hypothetical protein [Streptomyces sp. NPDC006997]|uniref:hypothetical protein n=1 Tax=Streptomyces sp. NPDC006997 TaxID=3155356 RepID=UPI0033EB84DD